MDTLPSFPLQYQVLKSLCRSGLGNRREYWWPAIIGLERDENLNSYPTKSKIPKENEEYLAAHCNDSIEAKKLILRRLFSADVKQSESAILEPLLQLLLLQIADIEDCYRIGRALLSKPERYLNTSHQGHLQRLFSFKKLLEHYMPQTNAVLVQISGLENRHLNLLFVDFFNALLPSSVVYRMLDAFFLEGHRVLMRYGLALIKLYKADIKSGKYITGDDFWKSAQRFKDTRPSLLGITDVAFERRRALTERRMKISGAALEALSQLSRINVSTAAVEKADFSVFRSAESGSSSAVLTGAQVSASTGAYAAAISSAGVGAAAAATASPRVLSRATEGASQLSAASSILTVTEASLMLSLVSPIAAFDGFDVAYCSSQHGFDLGALYRSTTNLAPCMLLLRAMTSTGTRTPAEDGEPLLGAYVSCAMSPPAPGVRGSPEAFVFRICAYSAAADAHFGLPAFTEVDEANGRVYCAYKFESVLLHQPAPTSTYFSAISNQFAVCAYDYISFGGSSSEASNAIRIDSELRTVVSGPTDTFASPPLLLSYEHCTSHGAGAAAGYFGKFVHGTVRETNIRDIEVLCGRGAMQKLKTASGNRRR